MQVITAPEPIPENPDVPTIFLAGGITNCPQWQNEIIELLKDEDGILLNPRRANFPIDDPNAAQEQIEWEYHALNNADVFSMWFSDAESDQPICMYELGRHLAMRDQLDDLGHVIIGVEPGYKREQDVRIQAALVSEELAEQITDSLPEHAKRIVAALVW